MKEKTKVSESSTQNLLSLSPQMMRGKFCFYWIRPKYLVAVFFSQKKIFLSSFRGWEKANLNFKTHNYRTPHELYACKSDKINALKNARFWILNIFIFFRKWKKKLLAITLIFCPWFRLFIFIFVMSIFAKLPLRMRMGLFYILNFLLLQITVCRWK